MKRPKLIALAMATLGLATLAHGQAAPALAAPIAPDGGALFKQRCQGCHSPVAGGPAMLAPNLAGVVGRKAASTGFAYSPALKASGLTWTRPNLDKYLSGPMQMVPGTRMVIKIANPVERAAVIDFLGKTKK